MARPRRQLTIDEMRDDVNRVCARCDRGCKQSAVVDVDMCRLYVRHRAQAHIAPAEVRPRPARGRRG